MKKILVTGATGFIGNHVIRQLLQEGYEVIASSAHPDKAAEKDWYPSVTYRPLDLQKFLPEKNYYHYFGEPDLLIHLAWEGLPNYKAAFHLDENLPRHTAFLSGMVRDGLKDLTVTGTCLEYGLQEGCLSGADPVFPVNPYAQAKNELRIHLETLQKKLDFNFKWVRLFYMYGEGQNPNSILAQLGKAIRNGEKVFPMSGGEQLRDYLPVTGVASNIVHIATQHTVQGVINCCSGRPVSIMQLVNNYLAEQNATITLDPGYYPYTDYEPMAFWGDRKKLDAVVGNKP